MGQTTVKEGAACVGVCGKREPPRMSPPNQSVEGLLQEVSNRSLNATESPEAWDPGTLRALKISLAVVLSIITLATVLSNAFVLTTIFLTRKLHTPANYLIGSLAVTDLLVSILVMPISIVYTITHTWSFGQILCDIWLSSDITCCTASNFSSGVIVFLDLTLFLNIIHLYKKKYKIREITRHLW